MPFLDDLLTTLGAWWDRTHIFTFSKAEADGVHPRFMRDLRPVPETGLTGGHLLELYAVLDERYDFDGSDRFRFDVLEEDWLFSGGLDDRITSLLGQNAGPPQPGAPTRQLNSTYQELTAGEDALATIEEFKRTVTTFGDDYADTMLIMKEVPDPTRELRGTRRTHVVAWHRIEHDDIGAHSELYFILDVNDGEVEAASPVLEIEGAPLGAAVRLAGTVTDAEPFDVGVAEPLDAIRVTLGGRRAVSGQDGTFVLDARLPVGDHQLRFSRSGIDTRDLTVRVTADANDVVTAAVLDGATVLVGDSTPGAATEASLIELALPAPLTLRVHKLRGTVRWPDSRNAHADANYLGTPLAERRVYVLPLPAEGALADLRPKTTREWEALKRRSEVLRSTRPGDWEQRRRTSDDGRFEVKYVDFTAGNRFLMWVERFDPRDTSDRTTESPDHIVRAFRQELIGIAGANLATNANAGNLSRRFRLLVDHEYNLTRDVVSWGVESLRIGNLPPGLTLVRASRGARDVWDTLASDAVEGEWHGIPPDRIVDGANQLQLQILPLVPLGESADDQGQAAARGRHALAGSCAAAFPDGYDAGAVRLALDVSRLEDWIDWTAAPGWSNLATNREAQKVELLERTFVVRPELGQGRTLSVNQARWHFDALSLADAAFVAIPDVAAPLAGDRRLDAAIAGARQEPTHVPVLGAVAPLLPGLAPRRVYLAPGHGLFVLAAPWNSVTPANWGSDRGGYGSMAAAEVASLGDFLGAGEDETDAVIASEIRRIALLNGGTIRSSRELADFTAPGMGPGGPVGSPDFPRFWQQNPVYYLGIPGAWAAPANNKSLQGAAARTNHIRGFAAAPAQIDVVLAIHTNAFNGNRRGCLTEYLNIDAGGNSLGQSLSRNVHDRILERTHIGESPSGVTTMDRINSVSLGDLRETFDHWVLDDPGINGVCQQRVLVPAGAGPPYAVPAGHSADTVACWNRTHTNAAGVVVPPVPAGHAPGTAWVHEQFPAGGPALRIPVSLNELAFHDNADDAALLSRWWFRRLAAEAMAIGIHDELLENTAAVSADDVRAVLRRVVGDTPALRGHVIPAVVGAADVGLALRTVAAPGAVNPPSARLGDLVPAAIAAARSVTRRQLLDTIRDALRGAAGWRQGTDTDAMIEDWVAGPITAGAPLARPGDFPTRAEAGALACTAIGLAPASLATAETLGVGAPPQPLLGAAAGGESAYFPRIEARLLAERLRALRPQDVYRVSDARLVDAGGARLDSPRGSGVYELDPGTPLVVVCDTAGAAWRTPNQTGAEPLEDIEFRLSARSERRALGAGFRDPHGVISGTWILDLPSTAEPVDLIVELWIRHRERGLLRVDPPRSLRLQVRAVPAP